MFCFVLFFFHFKFVLCSLKWYICTSRLSMSFENYPLNTTILFLAYCRIISGQHSLMEVMRLLCMHSNAHAIEYNITHIFDWFFNELEICPILFSVDMYGKCYVPFASNAYINTLTLHFMCFSSKKKLFLAKFQILFYITLRIY